jgi:hypothetical protein
MSECEERATDPLCVMSPSSSSWSSSCSLACSSGFVSAMVSRCQVERSNVRHYAVAVRDMSICQW